MRRVLLFAAFLLLLGLSTAMAASFEVQAEDITSFTTEVSISVPTTPDSYYLRGGNSVLPGVLDNDPDPEVTDPVRTKEVLLGTGTVQSQTQTSYFHSWETTVGGITLSGPASLRIFQNGGADQVTAALFDCPTNAGATAAACTQIGTDAVSVDDGLTGYVERVVSFGNVGYSIAPDRRLRVQIANLQDSSSKWSVQWGYKSNRPSLLDVTVVDS